MAVAFPNPLYVLLQGNKFLTIIGATHRGVNVDQVDVYYGDNYRDEISAAFLGRSPVSIIKGPSDAGVAVITPLNGDVVIFDTGAVTAQADEIATMMQESDSFTHTPPIPQKRTVTFMQWLDAAANVMGECPIAEFLGTSAEIPQTIGNTPPAPLVPAPTLGP